MRLRKFTSKLYKWYIHRAVKNIEVTLGRIEKMKDFIKEMEYDIGYYQRKLNEVQTNEKHKK